MAAVEITISGVLYDKYNRTQQNVVIFGEASLTGLHVGGGPIMPPNTPPGGGGSPGVPTFPIWGPPGSNFPGGPGYPPVAGHPLPEPPDKPDLPPLDDPEFKMVAVWAPAFGGWVTVIVPVGDTPTPTPSK